MARTFQLETLVVNTTLANIPLCTGFTYDQWKKGMNVMIEKTCMDFNVEKLHIIPLFKVDFNANNKWIGQAVMYQVEHAHLLAEDNMAVASLSQPSINALTNNCSMTLYGSSINGSLMLQ